MKTHQHTPFQRRGHGKLISRMREAPAYAIETIGGLLFAGDLRVWVANTSE
jgi:hypothetical protein